MIILGTNSIKDTGYDVDNSLRFNTASSDFLNRTPSSAGNRRTWTFSCWIKKSDAGTNNDDLFNGGSAGTNHDLIFLRNDNKFEAKNYSSSAFQYRITTNRLFRDVSAWYHLVVAFDSTQGTESNRVKLYVNGVQETSLENANYPSQNFDSNFNNTVIQTFGRGIESGTSSTYRYLKGYASELCWIDGQQLDPTSFGEFDEDSGIWKPIDVSGLTFGTNGFYLDFENSGSLGADVSGNGNNFTVNNLTSIDQSTDTCTNNFATWNPLFNYYAQATFSEGNLQVITSNSATNVTPLVSTMGVSTGKWYCEVKYSASTGGDFPRVGVCSKVADRGTNQSLENDVNDHAYQGSDGNYLNNATSVSYGATYTTGDIIGVALDLDNGYVYFHKNGTYQNSGDPTSGATGTGGKSVNLGNTYFFATSDIAYALSHTMQGNFGSPPFTISSGNSDANGYGNFEYAVPSSYYSLCTKNLSEFG